MDSQRGLGRSAFTLVELMLVIAIIAIIMVIAIPNLIEARKSSNQGAAVGSLKTIISTQTMFKEQDAEADQKFDYGTLTELSETVALDAVLGSGTKSGYFFQVRYSSSTPDFLWYGTANPAVPQGTGDVYFATNQRGVIFYTFGETAQMELDDCEVPPTFLDVYGE